MPIAVSDVIKRAGIVLNDVAKARWDEAELCGWINDAAREIIIRKPEAGSVLRALALVAGTRQQLPETAIAFLDALRNMGVDGSTPGRIVTRVDRRLLDTQRPTWHADTARAEVRNFVFDPVLPRTFWVYPPSTGGVYLDVVFSEQPAVVATAGDTLAIQDQWTNAVVNYVLYRAFSKDSEYADGQAAVGHFGAFLDAIGEKPPQAVPA